MKLIKIEDVADILVISLHTARKWAKVNPEKLPPRFILPNSPKLIRYDFDEINNWLLNESKCGYSKKSQKLGRKRGKNS